ncbi:NAD(P)H:quinone oxidoreductase [Aminobacter aminovorans]|jgi:NAD(P)H dehydrogenase (quinone)|uniref:NAD(P)H dehydrogenase (Quinone) n=3 Tax=Aminobacter aminovorans TaxID=83263 RepID=A0ABR6HHS3_AMIAI|nr:NAD(P)H:quinone oxidoreductase [Aminobacter aminovorans]MBB3710102.1 NAD(P)H dehydrogenase (quinone) [Aminobacter aminovorans]
MAFGLHHDGICRLAMVAITDDEDVRRQLLEFVDDSAVLASQGSRFVMRTISRQAGGQCDRTRQMVSFKNDNANIIDIAKFPYYENEMEMKNEPIAGGDTTLVGQEGLRVLVLFHSWSGNTHCLAKAVAAGAVLSPGTEVTLRRVPELRDEHLLLEDPRIGAKFAAIQTCPVASANDVVAADVVMFGCPTRMGTMSAEMKCFIDGLSTLWRAGAFEDKVGAAFTTASTPHGGHEMTLMSLAVAMTHLGMVMASPGYTAAIFEDAGSPYGATATSKVQGVRVRPSEADLVAARALGRRAARIGRLLRRGRDAEQVLS